MTIAQFVIPLMMASFANAAIYRKLKVKICEARVFEILVARSYEWMHQAPGNGPFQTQNYIDISLSCFAQNQNMSNKKELELFLCIESRP